MVAHLATRPANITSATFSSPQLLIFATFALSIFLTTFGRSRGLPFRLALLTFDFAFALQTLSLALAFLLQPVDLHWHDPIWISC